jgi:hemoglobin
MPFEWMGGEPQVKALVDRFCNLMGLEPRYNALRVAHPGLLDNARQRLDWFLSGWLSEPQHYTQPVGQPMLKIRHLPEQTGGGAIGIQERDQWLACMNQAMLETGVDDALRTRLNAPFFQTADWTRKKGE